MRPPPAEPEPPEGSDDSAFAPPRGASGPPSVGWGRASWYLRTRVLRLAAAAAIWGLWANLWWPGTGFRSLLAGAAAGIALWLPTTAILFRVVFYPGEPDPRVADIRGDPVNPEDHRWTYRVLAAEHVLGAVPLMLFAAWAMPMVAAEMPLWAGLLVVAFVGAGWQLLRAIRSVLLNEWMIELALGRPDRAMSWLRVLRWLPGGIPAAAQRASKSQVDKESDSDTR